jgi:hypothetical protein
MANFSDEAISTDDVTSAWCDRWASLRATTEAPSTDPTAPAATSTTAAVAHTRRGLLIVPTLSLLASPGKDACGVVVTLTGYEP